MEKIQTKTVKSPEAFKQLSEEKGIHGQWRIAINRESDGNHQMVESRIRSRSRSCHGDIYAV